MKKLPYIRQGQQLTIDILNGIIKAINSSILERKEYDSMMADITRMFNSYQSKVDNFILKYQDVVDNTPGLMDLLQSYSTLASMVNGTYVASVGSVNITAAGFNIQGTMGRVQFDDEKNYAQTYPQYSSLLITEITGATTLVYNVAPFESTPIWIEMNAIAGPQGPQGDPGPQGPSGEPGVDGEPGQITSIKGEKASLEDCLSLPVAPASGDAYVVDAGEDGVTLYVYFDGDPTDSSSWIALNNIRGPVGPQGKMAEIRIQYSNYADGTNSSDVYDTHSFMIISEDGGSTRHVIKLTPKMTFGVVNIKESQAATTPYTEVSRIDYPISNEAVINTTITIPYLRTVEEASIIDKDLHLKYRGTAGTTKIGRVVYDPAKIVFANGIPGLNTSTLKVGDVIIDTSDNYKIYNYNGQFVLQGSLQGPAGSDGAVGASFNLVGNWSAYGEVEATAGNIGNAYFLPADDDGHLKGLYVSSETSPGVYEWVFAGNSQGPQGATGATGAPGPRGTRITAGEEFYYNEADELQLPNNSSSTYKQDDLYLNTTSCDLFRVTAIGLAPDYPITAVYIGNIKGLGITSITVDEAEEELTITYSDGETTKIPINTIYVAGPEYTKAGLVVHKTDESDKGVFTIEEIGTQSDTADPGTFTIWGNADDLERPGTANAGSSKLIPRADHVHPAQTSISGNAGSATRLGTTGTPAADTKLVLGNGQAPGTFGGPNIPIYINNGVPVAIQTFAADGPYSKVIRTQAEFEYLIADATWLGAESVALVGGPFTRSNGIKIPATVKQIHGFNSAKITITNFAYNKDTAKGGLWYDTRPTTLDYSIRDLEVDCAGDYSYGFINCTNLTNCIGTVTGTYVYGFNECTNLTNCTGTGTGTGTYGYGFRNCTNLTNCIGTGTGNSLGYGFNACANLTNCTGTGTGTYGYGFNSIDYASNCRDGGSSIDMWGGDNTNIDLDTCCKTPVTANNTTLNT